MRSFLLWTSLLIASTHAFAADAFLCTDAFQGGTAGFQNGFVGGEEAAERIDPPASALPMTISDAWLFFGENDDLNATTETIEIDDVDGTDITGGPGTVLASTSAQLVDSTDSIQQVTFETPVVVNGPFWIALHFDQGASPEPGPATDGTAGDSTNAAILSSDIGFWVHASDLGVHGDWVLRVEGDSAAPQNDAACRVGDNGEGEGAGEGEGEGVEGEGEGVEGEGVEGEGEGASTLVITSVNPATAVQGEDEKVTITGAGFVTTTAVRVGPATCGDEQIENAGALLCTVPGTIDVGTYDVIAQNGADVFVFPSGFSVAAGESPPQAGGCASSSSTAPESVLAFSALACLLRALRSPARAASKRTARRS